MTEVLPEEGGPATTSNFIFFYDLSHYSFTSIGLIFPIVKRCSRMFAIANTRRFPARFLPFSPAAAAKNINRRLPPLRRSCYMGCTCRVPPVYDKPAFCPSYISYGNGPGLISPFCNSNKMPTSGVPGWAVFMLRPAGCFRLPSASAPPLSGWSAAPARYRWQRAPRWRGPARCGTPVW